jgi:hypothetical protein
VFSKGVILALYLSSSSKNRLLEVCEGKKINLDTTKFCAPPRFNLCSTKSYSLAIDFLKGKAVLLKKCITRLLREAIKKHCTR